MNIVCAHVNHGIRKESDDEEIFVNFGTSISPCLIKSVENSEYVYMILPIRLKE